MSQTPQLRIIQGSKEADERRLYRLRQGHETESATAVLEWPRAGAWRELVHHLLRNPVLPQ